MIGFQNDAEKFLIFMGVIRTILSNSIWLFQAHKERVREDLWIVEKISNFPGSTLL